MQCCVLISDEGSLKDEAIQVQTQQHDMWHLSNRTGIPGKMGTHFPVGEKSGNSEQTGKVREFCQKKTGEISKFYPKYWKSEGILASEF